MSYARWGCEGSDVYVYGGLSGIVCCECALSDDDGADRVCKTNREMIIHLEEHRAAGDTVPESALEQLRDEDASVESRDD